LASIKASVSFPAMQWTLTRSMVIILKKQQPQVDFKCSLAYPANVGRNIYNTCKGNL
jgi:hypothetical protein